MNSETAEKLLFLQSNLSLYNFELRLSKSFKTYLWIKIKFSLELNLFYFCEKFFQKNARCGLFCVRCASAENLKCAGFLYAIQKVFYVRFKNVRRKPDRNRQSLSNFPTNRLKITRSHQIFWYISSNSSSLILFSKIVIYVWLTSAFDK